MTQTLITTILTGSFGVGKSSIFNRFIYDEFEATYSGTIGARINGKKIEDSGTSYEFRLWDVAGEVHQNKVPTNYFNDKDFITYVVDLSRPFTFKTIPEDIVYLKNLVPDTPIKIIGNKKELLNNHEMSEVAKKLPTIEFDGLVSALTGENVQELLTQFASKAYLTAAE